MSDYLGILLIILMLAGAWQIFIKAGREGWEAIIPIYNIYVLTQITGQPWWLVILSLTPVVNVFATGYLYLKLSERFGQPWPYMLGLLFLPFVFFPLLGFGNARYSPPA